MEWIVLLYNTKQMESFGLSNKYMYRVSVE